MNTEQILTNANIVCRDRIIEGTVRVVDGKIAEIDDQPSSLSSADDLGGDYLLPGLVELHSDNVEKHFAPRPGVAWPSLSAMVAHDTQMTAAGVTTVLDAIRIGDTQGKEGARCDRHLEVTKAITDAADQRCLRADHLIHLRCEVSYEFVVDGFGAVADHPSVRLVSLMDHTPGQRQFVNVDKFAQYYKGKHGLNDEQLAAYMAKLQHDHEVHSPRNRPALVEEARGRGLPLASHDDAIPAHVAEAVGEGVVISEFPTTVEAAACARQEGLSILMGAPNLVLGGSHSGNVSAMQLAEHRNLDILSSDYVPASLLHGVFLVADADIGIELPDAVAMASATPAGTVGLDDRGEIAPGKRADLIHVRRKSGIPIAVRMWREGQRVL